MAATLYMELKKSIRKKDYSNFDETVQQAKQIIEKAQGMKHLIQTCAGHKESDGKNLLHIAAAHAA